MKHNQSVEELQSLIVRLKEAEKGYKEIKHNTSDLSLKKWVDEYARLRQQMRHEIERIMEYNDVEPIVHTSIAGDLHRVIIDIKMNMFDNASEVAINEIIRGSSILLDEYREVIKNREPNTPITNILSKHMDMITAEVNQLSQVIETEVIM